MKGISGFFYSPCNSKILKYFPICCASHPEQPLISTLISIVETKLFVVDEPTCMNNVVGTTKISMIACCFMPLTLCQQAETTLFTQASTMLMNNADFCWFFQGGEILLCQSFEILVSTWQTETRFFAFMAMENSYFSTPMMNTMIKSNELLY